MIQIILICHKNLFTYLNIRLQIFFKNLGFLRKDNCDIKINRKLLIKLDLSEKIVKNIKYVFYF